MEVFMGDFSIFDSSFDHCLKNLEKILERYEETNLVLNWEKCHFMVKEGIVIGHKVSGSGIEVDKAKIEAISKLPVLTESYEGASPEMRKHKSFGNVIAAHREDIMVSPLPQEKSLKPARPFLVSNDMKNGAIKLYNEDGNEFIVNKQRVKPYQKDVLDVDKNDDITLDDEREVI
ncbi:hypothetical protein Tco_1339961 [Tanacetum coccineum]